MKTVVVGVKTKTKQKILKKTSKVLQVSGGKEKHEYGDQYTSMYKRIVLYVK